MSGSFTGWTRSTWLKAYPTRKKRRKFFKRYFRQNGRRFCWFIAEYRHQLQPYQKAIIEAMKSESAIRFPSVLYRREWIGE